MFLFNFDEVIQGVGCDICSFIYIIIYLFIYLTFFKMPQTAKPELQNFKERSFGNKGCVRVQLKETPGRKHGGGIRT